jgi:hypothetical protein
MPAAVSRSLTIALLVLTAAGFAPPVRAQGGGDTDESAYAPALLTKVLGGAARSQNDEAELAAPGQWFYTTATYTGRKRAPSGRYRPLVNAWASSRGDAATTVDMLFGGELPELEFEQGGKRYWILAGLPGGLGFDVYQPGQKLTIYLQRLGFASGTPVALLTLVKLPGGAASATVTRGLTLRNARMGEGARKQEAAWRSGSATFTYAGREYTLPLDVAGRHSIAPGLYSYANGVRTALLEFGQGDEQYLLLRVPVDEPASSLVPYLVLNGHITPPIDLSACSLDVAPVQRTGARGAVDCAGAARAVLTKLTFNVN